MRRGSSGIIAVVCVVIAAMLVLPAAAISVRGLREDIFRADAAVVLGAESEAGGAPSARQLSRLDRAAELYRGGACRAVVVCAREGNKSAGDAVRRALVERGVPERDIAVGENSGNTRAICEYASEYMRGRGMDSAIVVTSYFHVPRGVMTMKSCLSGRVGSSYARNFSVRDILSTIREIPAFFAYSIGVR